MKNISKALLAGSLAVLIGCVMVPKTFEADIRIEITHIQQQADSVLDYIEGETDELVTPEPDADQSSMRIERRPDPSGSITFAHLPAARVFGAGNIVHAQVNQDSPRFRQIADSLKQRFAQVQALKKKGLVGENNRGLIEIPPAVHIENAEEKNEVQRVIAAENKDRKALYAEVARLNKEQNLTVRTVEGVYAQERLERAKPGDHVQLPSAGANFDAFKDSPAGKRLGDKCVPGAWIRIK